MRHKQRGSHIPADVADAIKIAYEAVNDLGFRKFPRVQDIAAETKQTPYRVRTVIEAIEALRGGAA